MSQGISNFQIEQTFKNSNDLNINDNFVGAFIDYKSMTSEKKRKISLLNSKH